LLRAKNLRMETAGSQIDLCEEGQSCQSYACEIGIPGSVYVANVVGALGLSMAVLQGQRQRDRAAVGLPQATTPKNHGQNLEQILRSLDRGSGTRSVYDLDLHAPKGRMELLKGAAPFTVLIDYAHSPGAFAYLLPEMKSMLEPPARLLVLFGSAGNRDTQKRPLQGECAARYADIIVLANEDPREEDEMKILEDIRGGIGSNFILGSNLFMIPDRRKAMARIFSSARPKDLVLLLGKGHETSIALSGQRELAWDEREIALALLEHSCTRGH
ncbi:MAG: cyanophycin synthetase, partial [Spirochaetota bacterium]